MHMQGRGRTTITIWEQQIPLAAAALLALLGFLLGHGLSSPGIQLNPFVGGHPAESVFGKLLVWACVFAITCGCRQPLRDLIATQRRSPLLLVPLAFGPIAVADIVGSRFAVAISGYLTCAPSAVPLPPFVSFVPRLAILGTTVLLVLLAWNRHLANGSVPAAAEPAPAARGEWLDLPEAPLLRVRAGDVVLIRSAGNYSEVVGNNGRVHLVRATLTELAARFAPLGFIRIHRQTIVNPRHVREIRPEPGGRTIVHLYCGISVPLGGRYMEAIGALR